MKKFASLLFALVSIGALAQGVQAVGPSTPPPGGYTGGVFSVYFKNIIEGAGNSPVGKCPSGYGIVGYSATQDNTYGTPICEAISSSSSCTPGGTGTRNICLGTYALGVNTTGGWNTAIGYYALGTNTTGEYNSALGYYGLGANTTGSFNIGFGYGALSSNTTGGYNTAVGAQSLQSSISAIYNTAVGYRTLMYNTSGIENSALGSEALTSNTTGNYNTALGFNSMYSNTTGEYNTAVGSFSMRSNDGGTFNTANGYGALYGNSNGTKNTANGFWALFANTTGNYNTAMGSEALRSATTGSKNTAVGYQSLYSSTTTSSNTAVGSESLYSNTTGNQNTALGTESLRSNTNGSSNVGLGYQALYSNDTGYQNTANGYQALYTNGLGYQNVALGDSALYTNYGGYENTAVGSNTLYSNTSGYKNVAVGSQSLYSTTTGNNNTGLGYYTLKSNTTGFFNTALGAQALSANTTGNQNTAVGRSALGANTSGGWNTAVGINALGVNTNGTFNSAYGVYSLFTLSSGDDNTALGFAALQSLANGYSNTAIGDGAGSYLTTGNSNIFIGYNAQPNVANTGSNQLNIGNWIYGNNGKIGIAVTNPSAKLDISDSPTANTASFRITTASNGFVQYLPNMSAGGWNSTVQAGDHGLIFSTDNNSAVSSNGLVIGAWNGGALRIGENGLLRTQSTSGYADIGAQNATYFHFNTDRPEFYMNKKLNVDGQISVYGVSNQWADFNANTYMANTSMYSYGRICVGNGSGDCTGAGGAVLGDNDSAAIALQTDGNIKMRNASPTIYLRDTDNRGAMIHNNSNLLYFLRGCGNDSASWCANGGYWPLVINLENNDVTIGGNAYANNYYYLSDKNLKKNIAPLTGSLDKLLKLNGYSFNWKNTGKKDIGVIAQDVEKIFPEIVGESRDANGSVNKTVQYGNLIAPVIEAIKELAKKQENTQKEIEILKKENATLLQRLEKLEAKIK